MELRAGLPPPPDRIKNLPIDARGYPIPWFVIEMPDGTRDFRIADQNKRIRAVRERLCWICGGKLGRHVAFVIGPMCAVNRNTSEPGCHRDCAVFAATGCPFLTRPKAQYRTATLPEGSKGIVGGLPGNPGACAIWITETFKPYRAGPNPSDWLIRIGEPTEVLWYCEGKPATRKQILDSFDKRLFLLHDIAKQEGPEAENALKQMVEKTMTLLPA
jgi:hypothetical protein